MNILRCWRKIKNYDYKSNEKNAHLEKQARAEKQPKKKFELVQKLNNLRKGTNK